MGKLFGTDGVRGIANKELTSTLAYKLGQAGAYVLTKETHHKPKIIVGKDTRISGDMLEAAISAGLCSVGAQVILLGEIPTPAVAYLTRYYGADAGIVISASHNPFEFNGIKFFNGKGYKLSDELEDEIESLLGSDQIPLQIGSEVGRIITKTDATDDYANFLISNFDLNLNGLKIAIDCANGAAYKVAPQVLKRLGAEVLIINNTPNGVNINTNCGSTHMSGLKQFVIENKADIGLAFDGDADRVLAIDENGKFIDGDEIMSVIGMYLKENNMLCNNTIVATVMSNLGFDIMGKKNGINLIKTKVGDRYVLEEMVKGGYSLGGEQSGHIIFIDYNTTGDGLLTGLNLIRVMKNTGKKISELTSIINILPQVLINAKVKTENKNKYLEDEVISKECKSLEREFEGEGRVLIRPSGTEPLVRVMIEGKDQDYISSKARELANLIEERLG